MDLNKSDLKIAINDSEKIKDFIFRKVEFLKSNNF